MRRSQYQKFLLFPEEIDDRWAINVTRHPNALVVSKKLLSYLLNESSRRSVAKSSVTTLKSTQKLVKFTRIQIETLVWLILTTGMTKKSLENQINGRKYFFPRNKKPISQADSSFQDEMREPRKSIRRKLSNVSEQQSNRLTSYTSRSH